MPWNNSNKNQKIAVKLEYIDLLIEKLLTYSIEDIYTGKADKKTVQSYLHATFINADRPLPQKLKKYITDAIFKIADGENAEEAIYPKRGPQAGNDKKKEIRIALRVWFLFNYHDLNIEDAIQSSATVNAKAYSTVREIYYAYRKLINTEYKKIESENGIDSTQYDGDALLIL